MGILDRLDVNQATRTFMLLTARRKLDRYLRILGPRRIEQMIVAGRDLSIILDEVLSPEQQQQIRAQAANYTWLGDYFTDEDLVSVIPPWAMEVIDHHGPAGKDWLDRQIAWFRRILTDV